MPAPVGRRAGQPPRVAGNARERRYSEAVALCRRHAPALGTSRAASRAARSLWAIGYLVDRGPLEADPSATCQLAGGGQRARLLESLSRCLGSAGAVSSALPWVAQPPSEQCANSWRCGVALSTVGRDGVVVMAARFFGIAKVGFLVPVLLQTGLQTTA
jgi:hypothetical protein